ncbi:MAG TPA: bifunctional molybdenum cofactor biosynthesis protein MoaC/MoaB [Burkholderiales bacterium]|nr:bifunctional molybdenum cofactor biosynthesis protein MoaC/MoaB [Burkholderiales bacterium]
MNSYYHMIDVSDKISTKRIAIACGKIIVGAEVLQLIKNGQMIKGDPLRLAEVAAIMGAKNTSALIPLCHPLSLDKVEFITELLEVENAVQVYCVAITSAKTGVEMEALAGVSAGLLTIYDLSKISEPILTISDIKLIVKIGGKSGVWFNPQVNTYPKWLYEYIPVVIDLAQLNCATITLSDRASRGEYKDKSGQLLQEILHKHNVNLIAHEILADEAELLKTAIINLQANASVNLIITTGGTGLTERDIVPETLAELGGRVITGIGEVLRIHGSNYTPFSWGSRSVAYVVNKTIIIALPGSSNAVRESMECLLPILNHLVKMAAGGNHD